MKGKGVLKALLLAYFITGILLMLLAFLLYRFHLGEGIITVGIVLIYVLSCFSGGIAAGRSIRKQKYLWGTITGAVYFLILCLVSVLAEGNWNMTISHAVTMLAMCLGGGLLGGMLA